MRESLGGEVNTRLLEARAVFTRWTDRRVQLGAVLGGVVALSAACAQARQEAGQRDGRPRWVFELPTEDIPVDVPPGDALAVRPLDSDVDALLRVPIARARFGVSGEGIGIAILDTGIRLSHNDFKGRIVSPRNFTPEGGEADATDHNGHGTNVAGIAAAGGDTIPGPHMGIAPRATIIPLKVMTGGGKGDFAWVSAALQWVIDNRARHRIGGGVDVAG